MAEQNLKNLLVFVPSANVDDFKNNHTGSNIISTDKYYSKVSFLGDGLISTHGQLFGMTNSDIEKIGLSALPEEQTSLTSYVNSLASSFSTLNGTLSESVQSYVNTAVTNLIGGAPAALDTLGEIAALLADNEHLVNVIDLQSQVGGRPQVNWPGEENTIQYPNTLYDYVAYYFNYAKSGFSYSDTEISGQYISEIDEENGVIKVKRTLLPSTPDSAEAGKYVSAVSQTNGKITVTHASLPKLSLNAASGAAGQYISALSVDDHKITATYTTLPNVSYNVQTGKYISGFSQVNGEITDVTFTSLPSVTDTAVATQYVSAVSQSNGEITVTRANLPTISVAQASTNYLTANDHEIGAIISSISTATGISATSGANSTTYSVGTETIGNGLITASNVYSRIHATETFVADALTTLDERIGTVVASATGDLDSEITLTDAGAYVSATIKQENGKLTSTGSSISLNVSGIYSYLDSSVTANDSNSLGSVTIGITDGKLNSSTTSLSINKTNILAQTLTTTTSGTSSDPIQVSIKEQNHKITEVSVTFNDLSTLWETYTPAQG